MQKIYRKGTIHPSPPIITDHLAFLPAAILTLAAALSQEDREVLSYLISCFSSTNFSDNSRRNAATGGDHVPLFHCCCFRCYMSYWVRWDTSPSRQLIHEIIDAFEDWLAQQKNMKSNNKGRNGKKEKRNNKKGLNNKKQTELNRTELTGLVNNESLKLEALQKNSNNRSKSGEEVEVEDKGSVRRFVSFIRESIWGAWGQ
ncbi:PREDICTED: uncharacterized protein LOC109329008 isoform X2 [Lupinus angustifolius]|uniref:uncharacterized protein LOC109329008 isoform X2 n=1 Tax=Lupinus angustifolius TaxID=3871 RepID=UPI00092E6AFF|nr:PREDICTED: uncharacterized protein LOC109329008 isoform X2 [Lupinus angustifolius]